MNPLQTSIIQTLSFFDLFAQPLTLQEIYRFLYQPPSGVTIEDVKQELDQCVHTDKIGGLYALKSGTATVQSRMEHLLAYIQKIKRVRWAVRIIRYVPFVKAVFVCNTVGFGVPTKESDIDVLVVTQDKRVFLARFLVTCVLSIFGLRRHDKKVKNKVCLSFYLSESGLNLQPLTIERDIYLAYWIALLIPIYDVENMYEKILGQNKWVNQVLPNALQSYYPATHIRVDDSFVSLFLRRIAGFSFLSFVWKMFEQVTKKIQLWWMKEKLARPRAISTSVVVSDTMLKFHEEDRRVVYRDEWERSVHSVIPA